MNFKQCKILSEEMFTKLPNNTVWTLENEVVEESLRKRLNYPFTVTALFLLYSNLNLRNYTTFSIKELIEECGYKVETKKIRAFKDFLKDLVELNILSDLSVDINEVKKNEFIKAKLNLGVESQFYLVYEEQFKKIFNSDYTVEEKNNAFTFLCYILSRIKTLKELSNGGNIQYCYFEYKRAEIDLGISKPTLIKSNEILNNLGLVYSDYVGKINNANCCNVYSLTKDGMIFGLRYSYNYYDCAFPLEFKPKEEYKNLIKDRN